MCIRDRCWRAGVDRPSRKAAQSMAPGDMYNDHYPLIVPAPPDLSESRLRTGNELHPFRKDEQEDPLRLERDLLNPADKSLDPRLVSIFESAEGLQGLDRNDKSAFLSLIHISEPTRPY